MTPNCEGTWNPDGGRGQPDHAAVEATKTIKLPYRRPKVSVLSVSTATRTGAGVYCESVGVFQPGPNQCFGPSS